MRLLVAGQSGLQKMSFASDLQRLCNEKLRDSCDEAVSLEEAVLRKARIDAVIDLEKEFQQRTKVKNYLDMNEQQFTGQVVNLQHLRPTKVWELHVFVGLLVG